MVFRRATQQLTTFFYKPLCVQQVRIEKLRRAGAEIKRQFKASKMALNSTERKLKEVRQILAEQQGKLPPHILQQLEDSENNRKIQNHILT